VNSKKYFQHPYLTALNERILVFDGAMGTNLEAQGLTTAQFGGEEFSGCNDHLNLSCPDAVRKVHRSFLEAGVDVIETNTFRSNRFTLGEFGLAEKVTQINQAGARLARQCADEFSTKHHRRFVAGSIGPSGKLVSMAEDGDESATFDALKEIFAEQAEGLILGGVDLLLLETQQDILEVKAAIHGIQLAFERTSVTLPIQTQVTLDAGSRMLLGTHISAAVAILSGIEIDVLGINCSTGPEDMRPALEIMARESSLPLSCLPNAGMPENIDGRAVYSLSPEDFSESLSSYAAEYNLNVVGGCCGTRPEHLRQLVKKIRRLPKSHRPTDSTPRLSSAFNTLDMRQEPAPLIIGERLNTQGSRAFKRILLEGQLDQALNIAKNQMQGGAHALDLCTALTETSNEAESMSRLTRLVSTNVDAPLVIDSTDPHVMEAALKSAPGRCLLNSINLESGEDKARAILALAKAHNAALIALTIDEDGMAKTASIKLAVAQRIRDLAVEVFGFRDGDLVFDPLTFTLASGSAETAGAGVETLRAIELIKAAMPETHTCLGVSNISFGLDPSARAVLNSVFLFHAVKAGLDMAILNPAQIKPYNEIPSEERELAECLIFNKGKDPLGDFIQAFTGKQMDSTGSPADRLAGLSLEERIFQRVLLREREGMEADLQAFIQRGSQPHESALSLLNTILLPAMKTVGDQFGRGELILPFVLQSAEIMRAATKFLEQYLEKGRAAGRGRIVLATVFGDVHDIGKNLVSAILSNNGYEVIDLGKQVPADTIVQQAIDENADALGLSALLVSTSQQMRVVVEKLRGHQLEIPVLVGGAAINADFADSIASQSDQRYPVFYCRDAFDALEVLDGKRASVNPPAKESDSVREDNSDPSKSDGWQNRVSALELLPEPPFIGSKLIDIPLEALFERLNLSALFRVSWGARNAKGGKWEKLSSQFTALFEKMKDELKTNPWLKPAGLYGFWPCDAQENDLAVYPDGDVPIRFSFPRQTSREGLCLADYFAPASSGRKDIVAFQIVTLGQVSADHVHRLQETAGITEAFYAHGLAVQLAEAAAGFVHDVIRKELGLGRKRGKRYSWGYDALPDLSQHDQLFKLLPAEEELGLHMTSAWQFIPEYTTAAMVVHHPAASYFRMD